MEDKLLKDVEILVKNIFSEKEEADMRSKTEEALQTSAQTIEDLTTALEVKATEGTEMATKFTEIEETVTTLQTELEAAKKEVETATEKLGTAEAKIEDMLKDKAMEDRVEELESAGVARTEKEAQASKVREMTDEEFTTYKEELVSIRAAIVVEMEAAAQKDADEKAAAAAADKGEADAGKEGAGEEEASTDEEEGVTTPPAEIDPSQAVSAALNMELAAPASVSKKYTELGNAMAKMFTKE